MQNDSIEPRSLHWLRQELKAARQRHNMAILVNVEDAIFTRLAEAEELLTVAAGLFAELSEDKTNWLFTHQMEIVDARWALHNTINDRLLAR